MLPSAKTIEYQRRRHGWAEAFFSRGILKQKACVLLAEGILPAGGEGVRDGPQPSRPP